MRRHSKNPNYVSFSCAETVVVFSRDRGELRTNDMGEFFLREMTDGRFTCASPDLERQLIDTGVRAGVPVGITRTTYNRRVTWKVRRIGQPVAEMPRERKASSRGIPAEKYATLEPPAPVFPEVGCAPEVVVPPAAAVTPAPNLITRCLRAAIDAAADASVHGDVVGFACKLGPAEIQAIACTLYIQAGKTLATPDGHGYRKPNGRAPSGYVNGRAEAHQ